MLLVDDTTMVAISTVLTAIITVGGSIAVALISNRQKHVERKVEAVHEQLKTSNGTSVGEMVEKLANDKEP